MRSRPVVLPALLASLAGALLLSSSASAQAFSGSVAFLPLEAGEGVADPDARKVDNAVIQNAPFRADAQERTITMSRLQAAKDNGLDCPLADPVCRVQLGIVSEVEQVAWGRVLAGDEDGVFILDLELVSVLEGRLIRTARGPVRKKSIDADINAVFDALAEDAAAKISLTLDVAPAGATVSVDGEKVGIAPLSAPLTELEAGSRAIATTLEGYAPDERSVDVRPGDPQSVSISLAPLPGTDDGPSLLVPASVLGLGLVSALVGSAVMAVGLIPYVLAQQSASALVDAESRAASDPTLLQDDAFRTEVATARESYDANLAAFGLWGGPVLLGGLAAASLGLGATGAGALWLTANALE